jgi:hypothetical protein
MVTFTHKHLLLAAALALTAITITSCQKLLGWGVLLWEEPQYGIPSGAVLPVYIKSNIDKVWVAGIPEEYLARGPVSGARMDKVEIPLAKLELLPSKKAAAERARAFSEYAMLYAQTLLDGLPMRDAPDNGAKRVYRLREGEIIKIVEPAKGTQAIGADGKALPGNWYLVMTEGGTKGYCFSNRLKLFEHVGGELVAGPVTEAVEDKDLTLILEKKWPQELYLEMIQTQRLDLDELEMNFRFEPQASEGAARVYARNADGSILNKTYGYSGIKSQGNRSWIFEGAPISMTLLGNNSLALHFSEEGGETSGREQTVHFISLEQNLSDLASQEATRREGLFRRIYERGPQFASAYYGSLALMEDGSFTWTGSERLAPQLLSADSFQTGRLYMSLFLDKALEGRYDGAFTFMFDTPRGRQAVNFMYLLESTGGMRIEYVPPESIQKNTVARRSSSPMIIYFYRTE